MALFSQELTTWEGVARDVCVCRSMFMMEKDLKKVSVMGFGIIAEVCCVFGFALSIHDIWYKAPKMVSYYSNNKNS